MVRRIATIILAVSFTVQLVTVVFMLFGYARGGLMVRARYRGGYGPDLARPFRAHREFFPTGLHEVAGGLVLTSGLVHIYYNRRRLVSYFTRRG